VPQGYVTAYRALYVSFLVMAGTQTLVSALAPSAGTRPHLEHFPSIFLVTLATSEVVAAALFLFDATQTIGCVALLVVFAVAQVLSAIEGEVTLRFVYYAGTALFLFAVARKARASGDAR
jgi:hypothetical protein